MTHPIRYRSVGDHRKWFCGTVFGERQCRPWYFCLAVEGTLQQKIVDYVDLAEGNREQCGACGS